MYTNSNKRVAKADALQAESSLSELSFENKGFRSRGAQTAHSFQGIGKKASERTN